MMSALKLMCSIALAFGLSANATQMKKAKPKRAPARVNSVKKVKPTAPKLLNYGQLMHLSPAKRAKYLSSVRTALNLLERMQDRMLNDTKQVAMIDALKEMLAQFTFMDSAQADPPKRGSGLPEVVQIGKEYVVTCTGNGPDGSKLMLDPQLNVCVQSSGGQMVDAAEANGRCPRGYTAGYYYAGQQAGGGGINGRCFTDQSYNAFKPEARCQGTSFGLGVVNNCLNSPDNAFNNNGRPFAYVGTNPRFTSRDEANTALTATPYFQPESVRAMTKVTPDPASIVPITSGRQVITGAPTDFYMQALGLYKGPAVVPEIHNGTWSCAQPYMYQRSLGTCATLGSCAGGASEGLTVSIPSSGDQYCVPASAYGVLSANLREQVCPAASRSVSDTSIQCLMTSTASISGVEEADVQQVRGGNLSNEEIARLASAAIDRADAPSPAGGTCAWAPLECPNDSPTGDKAKREAFQKAHNDNFAQANQHFGAGCIFAGNFTNYPNNRARRGACTPVTRMAGTDVRCRSGNVLCNPVIYGVDEKGKGLCVPAKGQATKACADKVADPTAFHAVDTTAEVWKNFSDTFTSQFKVYCMPGAEGFGAAFQGYFCNECNSMGQAIASANQALAREVNICGGEVPAGDAPATGEDPATSN